ncbi:hypothetical protein [Limnohabitans sp.]|uniref:hypothetical protein n=1 Tax=Limnohabitans sp. TaxID=1907725 RepID=UPI00286F137F|nr:hypothetical protein [Limnohabitans sp.]
MTLIALATVGSVTPDPNTTLSAALAANFGLRRALPFVCAVPVGWGVLLILNTAGLGAVVLSPPCVGACCSRVFSICRGWHGNWPTRTA